MMPINPLGPDALGMLLHGNGRVTVANRGPEDTGLVILAAVIVRHRNSAPTSRQAFFGLDLRTDEAEAIETTEPTDQPFDGIEVLLRVFTPGSLGIREAYIATQPDAVPARQWEVGLRVDDGTVKEGEFTLPESPGLVTYLRTIA
ncbi:hypothetical protein AA309_29905 [Microvirga vignae]|uniref:Uncharacterized protein n=1 Tax=Microvirga vignae TaxID=1225564 RepID=A0A0H1R3D6_9HYPH|nr:hypothetical protein [Microvirga vignae]KLK89730.1 hypothetical protein AA309_29905 [Microvirga vignae]